MDRERWHHIDRHFAAALERTAGDRQAFLAEACGGDPGLRAEVEALLASDVQAASFLEPPAAPEAARNTIEESEAESAVGQRLGPYTLVRLLGRGGMGSVYLAERHDGQYQGQAAIKIVQRGLDSAELKRRFRAERQSLARLQHPNIARLLDGGTTEDGRPYLVLDYVEGIPIDRYCDQHRLSIDARLALFRQVCGAVHHAHQNLLVHRDLKPANVLVTAQGEPKLLDFGIAKQLDPDDPEDGARTRTGLRFMTPAYASPEQIRGEAVTTASDVYSLGVVLYELLTGRSPYKTGGSAPKALERAVLEQAPELPSAGVERSPGGVPAAAARRARPRELASRLRGDLDTILLMALRKEPLRRYASVLQFANDLERHQRQEPVDARRDSFGYRAAKFLRRHRWSTAATTALFLLLAGLSVRLLLEREDKSREREKAERALQFLVSVFRDSDPFRAGGPDRSARQILDLGARRAQAELRDQPELQAAVMQALGESYLGLGSPAAAEPLLLAAASRWQRPESVPERRAASLESLARLRQEQGRYGEARALLERVLAQRQDRRGEPSPRDAGTLRDLGTLARLEARFDDARTLYDQALALQRRSPRSDPSEIAKTLRAIGLLRLDESDFRGAEPYFRRAVDLQRRRLEPDHPDRVATLKDLAQSLHFQGRWREAEGHYREALALLEGRLGRGHPAVAEALSNLGGVLVALSRFDEATRLHGEALKIRRAVFGAEHDSVSESLTHLARIHLIDNRYPEAERLGRQATAILKKTLGPRHPRVAIPLMDLGIGLRGQGRLAESEAVLREAIGIQTESLAPDNSQLALTRSELGASLAAQKRFAEAEAVLLQACAVLERQHPPTHRRVLFARRHLANLYRDWGRPPGR